MSLDHYVSQVHLKNFYPADPPHLLYAIRKSDLHHFRCNSQSVCRIEEGSTNSYLTEHRAIEEFLKGVEPAYNRALDKLRRKDIDQESIYAVAGFVAYVNTCSPAAMRIHSGPLRAQIESAAKILDEQGVFGKAPPELGSKSMTELLDEGAVQFTVDGKYPQAMGISSITYFQSLFGNSMWEVLHNEEADSPFLTSDFPAAIERDENPIVNRIVPLAPDLAVRIIPDYRLRGTKPDLSFPHLRVRHRRLKHTDVVNLNRLIVRSAEDTVFSNCGHEWVAGFVRKNRGYRIEAVVDRVPVNGGTANIASQWIRPHVWSKERP